ncbi:MAG: hypothetical protein ABEK17_00300 [Candidatus Aenigmatarchaeota archaeon]
MHVVSNEDSLRKICEEAEKLLDEKDIDHRINDLDHESGLPDYISAPKGPLGRILPQLTVKGQKGGYSGLEEIRENLDEIQKAVEEYQSCE